MPYDTGVNAVFYHRYHIVWITKLRKGTSKNPCRLP